MDHLCVVLDTSGSMESMADVVFDGARELVEGVKDDGNVGVVRFNSGVVTEPVMTKVEAMEHIRPPRCSGTTALYDAICTAVEVTSERSNSQENVVIAIVTDGIENASTKRIEDVRAAVRSAEAKNWRVTFLGSNQDAVLTAASFGIAASRAMTYGQSEGETRAAFRSLNAANGRFVRGENEGFTAMERQTSMQANPPPLARSLGDDPARMGQQRWISIDPRTGGLVHYDEAVSSALEQALNSGNARIDIAALNATVYLDPQGIRHVQRTYNGERDVRRVMVNERVFVKRRGSDGFRVVPSMDADVTVLNV